MAKLDSVIVTFVLKMMEIVITIITAKITFYVDQTIVLHQLVLTLKSIVVIKFLLEMKIFVNLEFLVEKMKGIVILMLSVKATTFVDQTTAQFHLALTLKLIVVVVLK